MQRRELEQMTSDPSVLDMIPAVQPLTWGRFGEPGGQRSSFPTVADDVVSVRELPGPR